MQLYSTNILESSIALSKWFKKLCMSLFNGYTFFNLKREVIVVEHSLFT